MELILKWQNEGQSYQQSISYKQSITLGRHSNCDITLNDPRISRHHALIFGQGRDIYLKNLSQTNPIFILSVNDGRELNHEESLKLQADDQFQIGSIKMEVNSIKKPSAEKTNRDRRTPQVTCSACKKRVDFTLKDCPWCGASLAQGLSIY